MSYLPTHPCKCLVFHGHADLCLQKAAQHCGVALTRTPQHGSTCPAVQHNFDCNIMHAQCMHDMSVSAHPNMQHSINQHACNLPIYRIRHLKLQYQSSACNIHAHAQSLHPWFLRCTAICRPNPAVRRQQPCSCQPSCSGQPSTTKLRDKPSKRNSTMGGTLATSASRLSSAGNPVKMLLLHKVVLPKALHQQPMRASTANHLT